MFEDFIRAGNYGLNALSGIVTDPGQQRGMNAEQMAEYIRRHGDPRNVGMSHNYLEMMNAVNSNRLVPKPTMTLAEWDARRAAFRALERVK